MSTTAPTATSHRTVSRPRSRGTKKKIAAALLLAAAAAPVLAATPAYAASNTVHVAKPAHAAASSYISVDVQMDNHTGCDMSRVSYGLSHGVWKIVPPETITKHYGGRWLSESNGFMTGTAGTTVYRTLNCDKPLLNNQMAWASWNNPYSGSNSATTAFSSPLFYQIAAIGGGRHPKAIFLFE